MRVTVCKWGNSLGVRISRALAEDACIREGSIVDVRVENWRLVAVPVPDEVTLDSLLAGVTPATCTTSSSPAGRMAARRSGRWPVACETALTGPRRPGLFGLRPAGGARAGGPPTLARDLAGRVQWPHNGRTGLALCCPITTKVKGYPFEVPLPRASAWCSPTS